MSFCHLHCHDEYSLLDGLGTPDEYARKAKELGFTHLAITNHGNVDGAIKFQNSCKKYGIKPIFGAELYIVKDHKIKEKGEKRKHINILVRNQKGWENLLELITKSNTEGFYYRPRISVELLLKHIEGLVILTACSASLLQETWGIELIYTIHKESLAPVFIEIMPHDFEEQKNSNKGIVNFAKFRGIPIVGTNDCHYIKEGQEKSQEVLLAVQTRKKWTDKDRWKFEVSGLYLKDKIEMLKAFKKQGVVDMKTVRQALDNTMEVAKLCEGFEISKQEVNLPKPYIIPEGMNDETFLRHLCLKEFELKIFNDKRKNRNIKEYESRFDFEYEQIKQQGFARYFLIVYELIRWCELQNIMVGPGRGSSGGSLICYLLGITKVDPVKFNLLFARFISPSRNDLPDIDIDFEDIKKDQIRKHLEEVYGKNNVAGVSTFTKMKGKMALKDVGRVFGLNFGLMNLACKYIETKLDGEEGSYETIKTFINNTPQGISFYSANKEVSNIAMDLEGQIRGKGQHAAAIVLSTDDLTTGQRVSLTRSKKEGELNTGFDKHDIEHVGLMKLDVLGLSALTILNFAKKMVKDNHGIDVIYEDIRLHDRRILDAFTDGKTTGVFQFNSEGMRKFIGELEIDNFNTLVAANALFRPGTLRNGMASEYIDRKNNNYEWESIHEIVDGITKDTYGVILYQEQVMELANRLAGLDWKICDKLRKIIGKSQGDEEFNKFKDIFAQGCVLNNTIDKEEAEELWEVLKSFGSYSFNKSHAVEYSMISYWTMYMKINYPYEFICAFMTYGNTDEGKNLIEEAIKDGIDVRPPKVGISDSHKWIIKNSVLYAPFIAIKGFGDVTAEQAKCYKDGGFFKSKQKTLSTRYQNILKKIGAFDDCEVEEELAQEIESMFDFLFYV